MKNVYLIDTQCFLWWLGDDLRLSYGARDIIGDPQAGRFFSTASVWEIAIKYKLGKLSLPEMPQKLLPKRLTEYGVASLPINDAHALATLDLPMHHADPFDRILIAQARVEGLTIVTADRSFERYDVAVMMAEEVAPYGP